MAEFKLGFATLASMLGDIAGQPLEDERYQANGDSTQHTTTGLMVWRKADNWTAFTDGYRTWVNGPHGLQERLNTERFDWEATEVVPSPKRFAVWNGVTILPQYTSLADIAAAVAALCPQGDYYHEWLVKAGEGGTWQSAWDSHPLAIDGPDKLRSLYEEGRQLQPPLAITPYVVIRGRPAWDPAEIEQVAQAAAITGRVVLNLETGPGYWNGPTDATVLADGYLIPLRKRIAELAAGRPAVVELAGIPRQWVVDQLGGDNDSGTGVLDTWAEHVDAWAWECYDAAAPDLNVAAALDRVKAWLDDVPTAQGPQFRIPIVQRSRISAWAGTPYAEAGFEVWCLDGGL